jgi:hypothetical protein
MYSYFIRLYVPCTDNLYKALPIFMQWWNLGHIRLLIRSVHSLVCISWGQQKESALRSSQFLAYCRLTNALSLNGSFCWMSARQPTRYRLPPLISGTLFFT